MITTGIGRNRPSLLRGRMSKKKKSPRPWGIHDRGGFLFLLRLIHGGDGRFLPVLVVIMEVGGGYSSPCVGLLARSLWRRLYLRRGRHVLGVSPFHFFPAKFANLNLMGCTIGPSMNLGLYLYFWALPQSSLQNNFVWALKLKNHVYHTNMFHLWKQK
jgi:hypothetical protein